MSLKIIWLDMQKLFCIISLLFECLSIKFHCVPIRYAKLTAIFKFVIGNFLVSQVGW